MIKSFFLITVLASSLSFADVNPVAPQTSTVKSFDLRCDETFIYQVISKDGKAEGTPIAQQSVTIGTQTVTQNGDRAVYQTEGKESDFESNTSTVLVDGGSYSSTRTTKSVQISPTQVREYSTYTRHSVRPSATQLPAKDTSESTVSDFTVGADGTKTLSRFFSNDEEVKLDYENYYEVI
jgi:hypothetical protein